MKHNSRWTINSRTYVAIFSFIILAGGGLWFMQRPALAADFLVNEQGDTVDINPGDGNCVDAEGKCTLRAAVMEANALPGPDVINLPAGTIFLQLTGLEEDGAATGDLDVTEDLTVRGEPGLTIIDVSNSETDNQIGRAFDVIGQINVRIEGIEIQDGHNSDVGGGAIHIGSNSNVDLVDVIFRENSTTGEVGAGGAVRVDIGSTVEITSSEFLTNYASFGGGGLTIVDSATVTVYDSTFQGNSAGNAGGAIYPNGAGTVIKVLRSTFFRNQNTAFHSNANTSIIENSTFFENTGGNAGAIDSRIGTITVNYSTFAENDASGLADSLQAQPLQNGALIVSNSLLIGKSDGNCESVTDGGNNITWPSTSNCPGIPIDPQLGSFGNYGGETDLLPISFNSFAVDFGDNSACPTTDQRGVARPIGAACDAVCL